MKDNEYEQLKVDDKLTFKQRMRLLQDTWQYKSLDAVINIALIVILACNMLSNIKTWDKIDAFNKANPIEVTASTTALKKEW